MPKTWDWSIQLWVPHEREPDIEYHYTVNAGVSKMESLVVQALADAERDYPGKGYCLLGTTIHGVIVDEDALLDAHPDHLNHRCDEACHERQAAKEKKAALRAKRKAKRLAQHLSEQSG